MGSPRQAVEDPELPGPGPHRGGQELLVDASVGMVSTQLIDQRRIPARVHDPQAVEFETQGNVQEPGQRLLPLLGMVAVLLEGLPDDAVVPGRVLTQPLAVHAGRGAVAVGQRIVLMVAHDDVRLPRLHHAPGDGDGQADARPPVDQVAEEDHLASWMPIDPAALMVPEAFEQRPQGGTTAVHITDEVVAFVRAVESTLHAHISRPGDCSSPACCAGPRRSCGPADGPAGPGGACDGSPGRRRAWPPRASGHRS